MKSSYLPSIVALIVISSLSVTLSWNIGKPQTFRLACPTNTDSLSILSRDIVHQHSRFPSTLHAKESQSIEETTEKYGLEAGLLESLKSKDGGESAKSPLKKYGIAYLATSIPLAIISFAICYVLVDDGVDVAGLLSKIGINVNNGDASAKVGTFAIAYAAHKAASPIRFPPTVILTPLVAKMIGKEPDTESKDSPAK